MPSQDIPRQIYPIPTYTESYTPTHIDIKSSLNNLTILILFDTSFHLLLSTNYVPTA
jgi:hypothetical protein